MKKLTKEERDILNAICSLANDGKIPFKELEPLYKAHSKIVDAYIEEQKERERQFAIDTLRIEVESITKDIVRTRQELDKRNDAIAKFRAELEEQKNKERYERDESRISNLLYWIFNNEEDVKTIEDELKNKEAYLKSLEDKLFFMEI